MTEAEVVTAYAHQITDCRVDFYFDTGDVLKVTSATMFTAADLVDDITFA